MFYLNTVGLAGDNDLQNAEIGSIADFIVDIGKSCENVMKETDEAKKVCIYAPHYYSMPIILCIIYDRICENRP